jgi:hypothetical protein
MSFSPVTFSGPVSGITGTQGTSGTFAAQITGNADGTVSGTWSFNGTYQDTGYYATSGAEHISGTLAGSPAADGSWPITLAGTGIINEGLQLSFANGQFTLAVAAGFGVDYSVDLGYGDRYNGHDQFNFSAQLSAAGSISGGGTGSGTAGNDTLNAPASGNATIDGAGGLDTAVFGDVRANYAVTHNNDGSFTVAHGSAGTDTLVNVERLQFADAKVAIDIAGDGGEAYRLYQAAFDRTPDLGGLGYWINSLDQGTSLTQAASFFVVSPEFTTTYGNLDNQQFATQLYENVLHRAPDAGGLAFWQGQLDQGTMSRAQVLVGFSESPENQADVIGQIQDGFQYG